MDTLWASLIGLFLIALAVVLSFNVLQGRQTRLRDAWRRKLAGAGRPAAAPAAAAGRAEPGAAPTGPTGPTGSAGPPSPSRRIEPTLGPASAPPAAGHPPAAHLEFPELSETVGAPAPAGAAASTRSAPPAAREPDDATGPILDPRLDCIVPLPAGTPVGAERVLAAASSLRRAGSKPIAVEVDAGDGRWTVPHASLGAVWRVRVGVLLANRNGPLNAMEFSEFSSAVQALGRAIGAGGAIVPAMAPVLDHARQLDEACAQFDAVIGLNVETPTALSPAELAALATGLDLHERGNNRFAALGDDGEVLYSLALGERAEQLTLLLDVPRAPQAADPWGRMVEAARLCAERTGGRVVDDANRPLTDAAAAEVARQLGLRYRSLHEAGLDAGSPAALRVFN